MNAVSTPSTSRDMEKPVWLSIIVPVYNSQAYLAEAMDSLIAGMVPGVEVIVVDDGSTDRSPAIIADYQNRLAIKLITQPNRGQGRARNVGVAAAQGEYLYFFDSDDRLAPRFCQQLRARLAADEWPDVLLFCAARLRDADARDITFGQTYDRGVELCREPAESAVSQLVEHGGFFAQPCTYVSKKTLWDRHALAFGKRVYEDEILFLKLMRCARNVSVARQPWFERRIRPGSTMTVGQTQRHTSARHGNLHAALGIVGASARENTRYGRAMRRYIASAAIVYIHSARNVRCRLDWRLLKKALAHIHSPTLVLRVVAHLVPIRRQLHYYKRYRYRKLTRDGLKS